MAVLYPSIDALTEKADSKYYLVVMAARRARELQLGAERKSKVETNKNVTVALNEIFDDQISFSRTK